MAGAHDGWNLVSALGPAPDLHVIPAWEEDHEVSPECCCCPAFEYQDPGTGRRVWLHHEKGEAN